MKRKRKHQTTKNTVPKAPVMRHCVIEGDCNGPFKIVNDYCSPKEQEEFDRLYREWFDSPSTFMWCIESFIIWFKERHPKRLCMLYSDYERLTKGKIIPATKEEWESENN
jgi:hypothetical protein